MECPEGCTVHDCLACGGAHRHTAGDHACPGCGAMHRAYPVVVVSEDFHTTDVEYRSCERPDRIAAAWARWNAARDAERRAAYR